MTRHRRGQLPLLAALALILAASASIVIAQGFGCEGAGCGNESFAPLNESSTITIMTSSAIGESDLAPVQQDVFAADIDIEPNDTAIPATAPASTDSPEVVNVSGMPEFVNVSDMPAEPLPADADIRNAAEPDNETLVPFNETEISNETAAPLNETEEPTAPIEAPVITIPLPAAPQLTITVAPVAHITRGSPMQLAATIRNTGEVSVQGIAIHWEIPAGALIAEETTSCTALESGATCNAAVTLTTSTQTPRGPATARIVVTYA